MIILGFDDCYQELSLASAQAVVNYIGSGKATLFTHDCTSFYFLPLGNYRTENYGTGQSPYYVYSSSNNTTSFSMYIITLIKQKFCKIRTILPRNTGN